MSLSLYQAFVIKYAAVSCAFTLTVNVDAAVCVPDRSVLFHISCTLKLPDFPRPGTLANVNCFIAVAEEVLMIKTCTPRLEAPAKYSGVAVGGAGGEGLNGLAGVPITPSWLNARSSRLLKIVSCSALNLLIWREISLYMPLATCE